MSYVTYETKFEDRVKRDIERDNSLAAAADEMLKRDTTPAGTARYAKRLSRRVWERSIGLQHSIPPGPWDRDLDMYHEKEYSVALAGGYTVILRRSSTGGCTWNVYVSLPPGHCSTGRHYDLFNDSEAEHAGLPAAPYELTWSTGSGFGIDHAEHHDGWPHKHHLPVPPVRDRGDGYYTTFGVARKKGVALANYFKMLEKGHAKTVLCIKD